MPNDNPISPLSLFMNTVSPTTPLPTLALEIYNLCYETSLHIPAQVNECVNTLSMEYESNEVTGMSRNTPPLSAYTLDLLAHYNSYLFPPANTDPETSSLRMYSSWSNDSHLFDYNAATPVPALHPQIASFCNTAFEVDKEECEVVIKKKVRDECETALIDRVGSKLLLHHVESKVPSPLHHSESSGLDRLNIFYNIYLDADESMYNHGVSIVEEQTSTILNTAFANATVYYKTIGRPLPPTSTLSTLANFHHLGHHQQGGEGVAVNHHQQGGEEVTLTPLYQFCVDNPDENVAYIHNKGSYRDTDQNNEWRRRLMNGVLLSTECFDALHSNTSAFNVCGLRFITHPDFMFIGNMWMAKCSYVKTLLPPSEFTVARSSAVAIFFEGTRSAATREIAVFDFANVCATCFSVDRFALEHWIASSPHLSPADVLPAVGFTYICGFEFSTDEAATNDSVLSFKLQAAPRFSGLVFIKGYKSKPSASSVEDNLIFTKLNSSLPDGEGLFYPDGPLYITLVLYQTVHSLKAKMLFWKLIYNDFPKLDSWIWNHFGEREVRELSLTGVRNLGVEALKSGHEFLVDENNNLQHESRVVNDDL